MAEYAIILEDLAVMIRLGVHPHEAAPQQVMVSIRLSVDYPAPPDADDIAEVLDYDFVRLGILALAADRRFALQETLCEAVASLCLADARVTRVKVRTIKTDIYPDARIGCEIVRVR